MKIRIKTENYKDIIDDIKQRVRDNEFDTWCSVDVNLESGRCVTRIIHTPKGDNQYKDIQIAFLRPSSEDLSIGLMYLDIAPKKSFSSKLSDTEFREKSGVVLGRLCELFNNHFPKINEYSVYTK